MMCTFQPSQFDRSMLLAAQPSALTKLAFDELQLFESVSEQYQHLGMRVQGAIAIHPSNGAFQSPADAIALMPEAGYGSIEITFDHPVERVVAVVNGARQIRLNGFDRHSNVLAHERTTRTRQIPAEMAAFPWQTLAIEVNGLSRIVFASDAPFLLQSLSYC